ncbi:MAG TPA: DUF5916 domain-containing protein [Pyrinomonadaceae bacterium]|nr:DUF5916 domain-containing protein [Pyrinomonadaceae bacterium]
MRFLASTLRRAALAAACAFFAAPQTALAQTAANAPARGGTALASETKPLAGNLFAAPPAPHASPTPTPTPVPAATPTSAPTPAAAGQDSGTGATAATKGGETVAVGAAAGGGRTIPTSRGPLAVPAEKASPVRVPRFESAPTIDGKLDEEVWKTAAVLKDFYQTQPGDNIAPSRQTEVLVGYDSKHLYVAFRAFDEPDKVRATVAKRDSVFDDDNVGMILDTFNDKRKGFEFFFNPFGVQADAVYTNDNEDFSVDIVHESKGAISQEGYVVEVAIPFKSLRYEAGEGKNWGAHFFRRIKRFNNEQSSWMPISREITGTLIQAGQIAGLEGISTERTLEIIPSLTLSQTGQRVRRLPNGLLAADDAGRLLNRPAEADIGLNVKYQLTPTVTLDFAYNPDFAQVEADATVVTANQRFPIFFEEKRPFFLEGKEIFDTMTQVVHTRAIVDPDYAAKLTGKLGRNTFGLIFASDNFPGNLTEDDRDFIRDLRNDPDEREQLARRLDRNATIGVLRFKRDVGRENSLGGFATTYNFLDYHNHLAGFDGRFKLDPKTITRFEVVGTTRTTGEGEPARRGFGYSYILDYTGRHFGYFFNARGRTRDYSADVGFTRRTDTNDVQFAWRASTEPKPKATLIEFRLTNFTVSGFDFGGRHQHWQNGTNFDFNLARQTFVRVGTNFGYERLFEEEFGPERLAADPCDPSGLGASLRPCTFFGEDNERSTYRKTIFGLIEATPSKKFSGYAFVGTQRGVFDFDFGAGPRYLRVSPAALSFGQEAPLDPGSANTFDVEAGVTLQPTDEWRSSLSYTRNRLTRRDTGLVAFDENIYVLRSTYQFTRFWSARARLDYATLQSRLRGQFLVGWTPNPGTSFFVGYNDDLSYNGYGPFSGRLEPGFRRNGRTFFIKASYLFRKSF